MTSTQSVTDLLLVDGMQPEPIQAPPPAGEAQAAPFSTASASAFVSLNQTANERGDGHAKFAVSSELPEHVIDRRRPGAFWVEAIEPGKPIAPQGSEHQPVLNNITHTAPAESAADEISDPFSLACLLSPDTPTLAGADTSVADSSASFLFDPAFLAATRETQGQPIDAVPKDCLPARFTVNREGDIVDLDTGEVDPVLTAQLAMGIR